MSPAFHGLPSECSGHCEQCEIVKDGQALAGDPAVRGWRMVLGSTAVFLLPLALAAAGAYLAGQNADRQVAGALIGLAAGVLVAKGISAWLRRHGKAS